MWLKAVRETVESEPHGVFLADRRPREAWTSHGGCGGPLGAGCPLPHSLHAGPAAVWLEA